MYINTRTHRAGLFSVFWSGAERVPAVWQGSVRHMRSVYVALRGLLWSAFLCPDTICHRGTISLSVFNFFPSTIFKSDIISFNLLIPLCNYACLGSKVTTVSSNLLFSLSLSLASTSFLTLLISPFHNLPFVCLPTLSGASHFAGLLWEASEFTGEPVSLKTQAGVGVVAAVRDGYNNPCGGSTHVLNYCHKCSSIRPPRGHQSHSAISNNDTLFLPHYITEVRPTSQAPITGETRVMGLSN